ncbi:MAG: pyridoxal 5'-phosphate synthase glutaminase subunit PdxT [Methanothrix sp.]|nr:pyridoxal 5'-phosphate synthase glutaminase subunit PdxT [Methanothrix sp.]HOU70410.1 pyridoxal 5'-phosphate synthase glutaminase subunit PdxT [Methanothrix sp.]HUM81280.1 pyridoxal 5'-phosphate synthase glutaminase subunit PdxT [Methanothrix sp.]
MKRIGVFALQGDVSEHINALQRAAPDLEVAAVRRPGQIEECQALVIPGGESTTIRRQMDSSGITREIEAAARSGKPVLATCAGMVLVSKQIEGEGRFRPLGLMDIAVSRNAFGPQRESFEADLDFKGLDRPYRAVFIRAPLIVGADQGVEVLARLEQGAVAARQKNLLALAFHPELTDDSRIHRIFLDMLED